MSQPPVFLDTSGWIALLNKQDEHHAEAVRAWAELGRRRSPFILTDWVIAETGNGLAKAPLRGSFIRSVPSVISSSQVRLVFITEDLLRRSLDLYTDRPDKAWGMVDCATFVVMNELGAREAMTADHHFEQAGFRRLLVRPEEP